MKLQKAVTTFAREAYIIVREGGILQLLKRSPPAVYRRIIRPQLPTTGYVNRNGVPTSERKLFDRCLPNKWWHLTKSDQPNFEQSLVDLQREVTQPGDDVTIIAGGWGISMYYAYKSSEPTGSVTVYEASNEQYDILNTVASRLNIGDRCSIHHALVGSESHIYGLESTASVVSPADLPKCDVLELDCEGSELSILRGLEHHPREIFVEVHPHLNSDAVLVVSELQDMGYTIKSYLGHDGVEIGEDGFEYMMEYDRELYHSETPIGAKHPPVVWAQRSPEI